MTLDECRAALETAKLAAAEGHASPAAKNLLDWAEDVQDFLEAVFAPVADAELPVADPAPLCGDCKGEGHVRVEDDPLQIWDLCPTCRGLGKVKAASSVVTTTPARLPRPTPCHVCQGQGVIYEDGKDFICSECLGTGDAR